MLVCQWKVLSCPKLWLHWNHRLPSSLKHANKTDMIGWGTLLITMNQSGWFITCSYPKYNSPISDLIPCRRRPAAKKRASNQRWRSFSVRQNDETNEGRLLGYQPDQWRPTPGLTRPSIFGCGTDSDGSKKRTAILHWRTLLSYYYSSAALGTPSPPPITDDCSRPSHIEFSCGLPLATLPFSCLLIPFHAVVPANITAFTAGTPPLGLHRALATPPCGAWAQFVVADIWQ